MVSSHRARRGRLPSRPSAPGVPARSIGRSALFKGHPPDPRAPLVRIGSGARRAIRAALPAARRQASGVASARREASKGEGDDSGEAGLFGRGRHEAQVEVEATRSGTSCRPRCRRGSLAVSRGGCLRRQFDCTQIAYDRHRGQDCPRDDPCRRPIRPLEPHKALLRVRERLALSGSLHGAKIVLKSSTIKTPRKRILPRDPTPLVVATEPVHLDASGQGSTITLCPVRAVAASNAAPISASGNRCVTSERTSTRPLATSWTARG